MTPSQEKSPDNLWECAVFLFSPNAAQSVPSYQAHVLRGPNPLTDDAVGPNTQLLDIDFLDETRPAILLAA